MSMTTENRDVDDQSTQSAITDSKHFWFWDQLIVLLYPQGASIKSVFNIANKRLKPGIQLFFKYLQNQHLWFAYK